jgi:outer membrane lipoprotein-sorting protein
MKRKRPLLLVLIIFLCLFEGSSCKRRNQSVDEVITYLKGLKTYESNVEIYIRNDKQELKYEIKQYCDASIGYRLDISEDRVQIYKENHIYVTDKKNNAKYQLSSEFDELYKVSFVGEYIKLLYTNDEVKYKIENIDGIEYQLIETILPGNNKSISKAVMYMDIDKCVPNKILIYDDKGKERVNIIYKNFKTNVNISNDLFKVN